MSNIDESLDFMEPLSGYSSTYFGKHWTELTCGQPSARGATPVGGLPNYKLWGHGDVMYDLHNVANKTLNFGPIWDIFELTFEELSDESH